LGKCNGFLKGEVQGAQKEIKVFRGEMKSLGSLDSARKNLRPGGKEAKKIEAKRLLEGRRS